jgi:uncharacterized protein (TIGR00251 family)
MLIGLKVTAGARKESVEKISDARYLISVREPAEGNRANKRVLEIFCNIFPHRRVKIIKGHHAPAKIIEVVEDK